MAHYHPSSTVACVAILFSRPSASITVLLRYSESGMRGWSVLGRKRAPHRFRCLRLVCPHDSLARLKAYELFPYIEC